MPKMLTMDEQFEAIVADVASVAKMQPMEEPIPKESTPSKEEGKPEEKEEK